jgi:hypothetical protein
MRREMRRFEVTTDNGRRFTIVEYQDFRTSRTLGDDITSSGPKELLTSDGERVNVKPNGIYEIVGLGLTLRRMP